MDKSWPFLENEKIIMVPVRQKAVTESDFCLAGFHMTKFQCYYTKGCKLFCSNKIKETGEKGHCNFGMRVQ